MRHDLVLKALTGEYTITELAKEAGVSRKTAHKWVARFRERGLSGLVDDSRRPHNSPTQTSVDLMFEAIEIRKKHPTWGPKKVAAILARQHPDGDTPSMTTVGRVLKQAGLMKRRLRRSSGGAPMRAPDFIAKAPNDLWTVDFKGWWRTQDGKRHDPLTVRDAFSRFVLAMPLLDRTRTDDVQPIFEELFKRYGIPTAIQSDNGPPFASIRAPRGLTQLSAWWVSLGIQFVRSRPGCPQDNGGHERMHVDVRIELQDNAEPTKEAQQRACNDWITAFNYERPHEALGMKVPADVYRPSERRMTRYVVGGFPDGCTMATVSKDGRIHYGDDKFYLTQGLRGHHVGLQLVGKVVRVWFYHLLLGAFLADGSGKFEPYLPEEDEPVEASTPVTSSEQALLIVS